jgi:uncharacterized protein (TIGR02246 family)
MAQIGRNLLAALLVAVCTSAMAGPTEDASAAIDRWAAAYSSNDPETITKLYAPNAILLGTVSPVMSVGPEAILKYFEAVRGTGNTVTIGERKFIVLANDTVLGTGFYQFNRMREGKVVPDPARFSMILVKRGDNWLIEHHHSSPHKQPAQ